MPRWPSDSEELRRVQRKLADATPAGWQLPPRPLMAGCWICFPRGLTGTGDVGDPAWVAAVLLRRHRVVGRVVRHHKAGAGYLPGMLALREGAALSDVVRALHPVPDVLLVNATGRDHPLRAGLALHLGAVLDVPTVGVTHRPLVATGEHPPDETAASSPLMLSGELVGHWVRTRAGTRPLAVDAGWRTTPDIAVEVVLRATAGHRTPEPLRRARQLARLARRDATTRPAP